jgi:trigger factor
MISRYGGNERNVNQALEQSGTNREKLMDEWRPAAEQRTRLLLLTDRLAEVEEIEVSDQEVEQELKQRAQERSMEVEELRKAYEQNELMHSVSADLRNEKLFDRLIELAEIKDGDESSYMDLVSGKG